jgi:hypothetical protein
MRPEHHGVCLKEKLGDTGGGVIVRNELAAANERCGCPGQSVEREPAA